MYNTQRREIQEAIDSADNALYHLYNAKKYLGSASNWGLLDIFGGGLISGLFKHSKMGDAEAEIQQAKYALQTFSKELRDVSGYSSVHINEFLIFADFVFDGLLVDVLVQTQINDARRQCDDAIRRVQIIRQELMQRLNN